ncbi:tetratricopeptide repeat protein [Rhodovulum adriaticum]|uniref:Tetratricopeptide repeat protein n=1 Tax=Rhodovulum adriaticum TaxID=35804 RepID=A0A4R2NMF2_RHOAD|nr:tetratricopeptide repeat protein [Rhodovulum adriaticum]MBK1636941.1 tetratricopeptide repeat protein [Rhodovulum adriaticum]TCP22741.1 tetratricopeptide repeat protein [Rhodovulum adriaticum]
MGLILLLAGCLGATGPQAPAATDPLETGHRLMAVGEYEAALTDYYRAAAERGLTAEVLTAIGSANLNLGRLGQAERHLRRAAETDETFVPAWNNLGVVLIEQGRIAEARRVFQVAYGLDRGESDEIRENLQLAIAKSENPAYDSEQKTEFRLMRRGGDTYRLLATP